MIDLTETDDYDDTERCDEDREFQNHLNTVFFQVDKIDVQKKTTEGDSFEQTEHIIKR